MVDTLALKGDEGRGRLRYASGRCQTIYDPEVSEWGNPIEQNSIIRTHHTACDVLANSEQRTAKKK